MASIHPIKLIGEWTEGYALDKHIQSSRYLGEDAFGHKQFKNEYSEIGKLLYQLKYNGRLDTSAQILQLAAPFLDRWLPDINADILLPVPPTKNRDIQPLFLIAEAVAAHYDIPYSTEVLANDNPVQMKDRNAQPQIRLLKPAKRKCNVLLIDDLYSSGKTLTECTRALKRDALVVNVFVLTITHTGGAK
ncbi:MAG: hypothetical protein LBQ97_06035 [Fusobacteriaceae bacterium]|jgi:predicted amidophosphoribosyltransferase|nr:hypothetical protein [Fusobacteriaceae bacterium]